MIINTLIISLFLSLLNQSLGFVQHINVLKVLQIPELQGSLVWYILWLDT